jgi:hypothetical protein
MVKLPPLTLAGHLRGGGLHRPADVDRAGLDGRRVAGLLDGQRDRARRLGRLLVLAAAAADDRDSGAAGGDAQPGSHTDSRLPSHRNKPDGGRRGET